MDATTYHTYLIISWVAFFMIGFSIKTLYGIFKTRLQPNRKFTQ